MNTTVFDTLDSEITEITESIWQSVLGVPAHRGASLGTTPGHTHFLSGGLSITGTWRGVVVVQCPHALGKIIAARMLELRDAEVTEEDIRDAMGELTNMTGGNIKALLPGPSYLGLPVVVDGKHHMISVPDSHMVTQLTFECGGYPMVVSVVESKSEGNPEHVFTQRGFA